MRRMPPPATKTSRSETVKATGDCPYPRLQGAIILPLTFELMNVMSSKTALSEDDEGKPVVDSHRQRTRADHRCQGGTAYVAPDPGITEKIKADLGWETRRIPTPTDSIGGISRRSPATRSDSTTDSALPTHPVLLSRYVWSPAATAPALCPRMSVKDRCSRICGALGPELTKRTLRTRV